MTTSFGKFGVFLFIIMGIIAYLTVGVQLFDKVRSSAIRIEFKSLDNSLYGEKLLGGSYPQNLESWLKKNQEAPTTRKLGHDPWGQPYRYVASSDGFTLATAGPDRRFGTQDDMSMVRKGDDVEIVTMATDVSKVMTASLAPQVGQAPQRDPAYGELEKWLSSDSLRKLRPAMAETELAGMIARLLTEANL